MRDLYVKYVESPIGIIEIAGTSDAITDLNFVDIKQKADLPSNAVIDEAAGQLREYFNGDRKEFIIPLDLKGTEFQRKVWQTLLMVGYGKKVTYRYLAETVGNPKAVRAVGAANGKNPISIIIPCHRIIGSDGSLTGYGGGIWRKEWLLHHEGCL
jgi:methylated-DNA-[protein]-cysteine S-methyltransferase